MGRTARAGIYTEGSIIITDCNIYDNRMKRKNGGMYFWNDCMKLFDTKYAEPCGSSILSLVQDFKVDYDKTVNGEKFVSKVIEHLDESSFLFDYAKKLEKAYIKQIQIETKYDHAGDIIETGYYISYRELSLFSMFYRNSSYRL